MLESSDAIAVKTLMPIGLITEHNVERIAARIVANELEFRGFRVTDLNKDGLAANVDLLAAIGGRCLQIQVKGASQTKRPRGWEDWWVGYGYANAMVVAGSKPMFNRVTGSFYKADTVALVAVRTPSEYRVVILPVEKAEAAAQINLDHAFRTSTLKGTPRSPDAKASVYLDRIPKVRDATRQPLLQTELNILRPYIDNWDI